MTIPREPSEVWDEVEVERITDDLVAVIQELAPDMSPKDVPECAYAIRRACMREDLAALRTAVKDVKRAALCWMNEGQNVA
jgi:hypothetical protein